MSLDFSNRFSRKITTKQNFEEKRDVLTNFSFEIQEKSMATTKSKKALCHLVCEASAQVSGEIPKQELDRNLSDLKDGILCYPKPTSESLAAFTAKRNTASKLTNFILDLSKILGVEETKTKTVLETYLSGENFCIYMTKFIS